MTNPTSNFGWQMPTSTDLVTDLPADFEVFGQAVDTSLADLKGGKTGQVLAKASNTDMDFVWSADASGIPASAFTAKGAILVGTGTSTYTAQTVGTNGQVLTANSAQADGVEWTTISVAPTFAGCMLFSSTTQNINNNTLTAVQFSATDYIDTDGYHDPSTNNTRITIPTGKGGKYLVITAAIYSVAPNGMRSTIYLNGSAFSELRQDATGGRSGPIDHLVMNLSAGDYIEFYAYQNSGGAAEIWGTDAVTNKGTRFGVSYLGA